MMIMNRHHQTSTTTAPGSGLLSRRVHHVVGTHDYDYVEVFHLGIGLTDGRPENRTRCNRRPIIFGQHLGRRHPAWFVSEIHSRGTFAASRKRLICPCTLPALLCTANLSEMKLQHFAGRFVNMDLTFSQQSKNSIRILPALLLAAGTGM